MKKRFFASFLAVFLPCAWALAQSNQGEDHSEGKGKAGKGEVAAPAKESRGPSKEAGKSQAVERIQGPRNEGAGVQGEHRVKTDSPGENRGGRREIRVERAIGRQNNEVVPPSGEEGKARRSFDRPQRSTGNVEKGGAREKGNREIFGGNNGKTGNGGKTQTYRVPDNFRKMGVATLPKPLSNKKKMVTTGKKKSSIPFPARGPNGKTLPAHAITPHSGSIQTVRNQMTNINNNAAIINQVNYYNRTETKANNYYWHTDGGYTYCHYYDPWGYHWYGWYVGADFFWTRYYYGRWWWYDDSWDRWCYWYNGWWWWQDPYRVSVVFLFDGDHYLSPYASETVVETRYVGHPGDQTYESKDGTRQVRVVGNSRDAILYDTADPPYFRPVYLDSGVQDVKFSDTSRGASLQIMLFLKDGSFEMFDSEGNPYSGGSN